jgi:leucyl aminopeptidase
MSDDETRAADLLACAQQTDDRAWRLPNYPELGQYIRSRYADLRNTTVNKGQGGTLVGGEFLRQFVSGGAKWAHLDIAGTAFINQSEHWYYSYGATGAGTRLLTRYVLDRA